MKTTTLCTYVLFLIVSMTYSLYADEKGSEIMKQYFDLDTPASSSSDMTMTIIDSKNNKRVRTVLSYSRENEDLSERYIEFLTPADVKGTKFLTSEKGDNTEQRLFLPALGKIRRIAASDKGGSFMGTDLTYYDLETQDFEDFTYTFIEDKTVNKIDVSIVEATPTDRNDDYPYAKEVFYIRKDNNYPLQIDCYDEKDETLLKSIYYVSTQSYKDIIMPERMAVINHQDNQKTLLQFKNIAVNIEIPNRVFSVQNLER